MNLIRCICKAILFIAGFIVFYLVVIFALCTLDVNGRSPLPFLANVAVLTGGPGQSLPRFRELETVHDLDILIIGASKAFVGFDPRLFQERGYSAFNMGSTGQTLMNTYFLLKRYLPRVRPKVILLELSPTDKPADGYESTLDLLANSPLSWEIFEMCMATGNPRAVTSFLTKFYNNYKYPLSTFSQTKIAGVTYISGGYVETSAVRQVAAIEKCRGINVSNNQLPYLSKILDLAKSFNITVIGVIQPWPSDHFRLIINYKKTVDELRNIAHKHKVIILDFNEMMTLDPLLDFYDIDHLNKNGVLKFNRLLIDKLSAIKVIR